jgi:hypothetical protein
MLKISKIAAAIFDSAAGLLEETLEFILRESILERIAKKALYCTV